MASRVHIELGSIEKSLKTLFEMTQKSTLFNNEDEKINDLIVKIKERLSETQTQFNLVTALNHEMSFNKHAESVAQTIIDMIQNKLMIVTQKFKEALQRRSEYIRKTEEKRNNLTISSIQQSKILTHNKDERGKNRKNLLFLSKNQEENGEKNSNENDEESQEDGHLLSRMDEKINKTYFQSRMESMKNIEKMLHEVSGIFQRLGAMVKMHEVMIDRIDKNTDDTIEYVEKGKKELFTHYSDIRSNRGLMLKVFLIILIFSMIYIIFIL